MSALGLDVDRAISMFVLGPPWGTPGVCLDRRRLTGRRERAEAGGGGGVHVCVVLQLWTAQPPLAEWISELSGYIARGESGGMAQCEQTRREDGGIALMWSLHNCAAEWVGELLQHAPKLSQLLAPLVVVITYTYPHCRLAAGQAAAARHVRAVRREASICTAVRTASGKGHPFVPRLQRDLQVVLPHLLCWNQPSD
eukprot:359126-Chlamydomonas_euryale.AAC.2